MVLQEVFRYYKSKITILLILILFLIISGSYYSTYLTKKEWIDVLNSGASDVNIERVSQIINDYNGIYYFEQFILSSDFFIIFNIILLVGFGLLLSSKIFESIESNYGNLIITRTLFKKYLKKVLISQLIYIVTFIMFFFIVALIITLILFGESNMLSSSIFLNLNIFQYFINIFIIIFYIAILHTVIIFLSSLSLLFLRNKYIIQSIPFIILVFGYIIGYTFGNMSNKLAFITSFFVFDNIIFNLMEIFILKPNLNNISHVLVFIITCMIIISYLYQANIKKFGSDYLI
ncbi:hypothetical protein [Senegalia massiliensis]|uniref:ABC-2 family transporter protein n=1 Tax=Senegalia massiliensis TaxID=1720316 RepID=A0A845R0E3_9CLOT|nr:hypothetical protein [Senegalia massiliensis]NBI06912.1 hypothetical protein [Senegalia massiliensis]